MKFKNLKCAINVTGVCSLFDSRASKKHWTLYFANAQ
jgi:hypothetical protein